MLYRFFSHAVLGRVFLVGLSAQSTAIAGVTDGEAHMYKQSKSEGVPSAPADEKYMESCC